MGIRLIIEEKAYPMELEEVMKLQTKAEMFKQHGISTKPLAKITTFAGGEAFTSDKLWRVQNFLADRYGIDCKKAKAEFTTVIAELQRYWEVQKIYPVYSIIKGEEDMEYCDLRKGLLNLVLELTGHNKATAKATIKQFNQIWPQDQVWPSDVLWDFLKTAIKGGNDIDTTNYSE